MEVKVTDNAGNVTLKEVSVKIDKTPVELSVSGNADVWTNKDVTLDVVTGEDVSGIVSTEYQVNGGEWQKVEDNKILVTENGTVVVKVTDAAGNVTEQEVVVDKIDKIDPGVVISANTTEPAQSVTLTVETSDAGGSGIKSVEYQINGGEWQNVVDGKIDVTENGTVTVKVTDAVGNVTTDSYAVGNIDMTEPAAPIVGTDTPADEITNKPVVVTAEFEEDVTVIQYKIGNDGEWQTYPEGGVEMSQNGTVYFRGIDAAGNISAESHYTVTNIDPIASSADTKYVFVKSSYTEKNTAGKKQDGVALIWGENAFSSLDDAKKAQESCPDCEFKFVLVDSKYEITSDTDLEGVKTIAAAAVLPTTNTNNGVYDYKSNMTSRNTLNITGKNTGDTTFERFATVNVTDATVAKVSGGKGSTAMHKASETASGKFTGKNSTITEVTGFSNVMLDNSEVTTLTGGVLNTSDSAKENVSGSKVQATSTDNVNSNASGSATVDNGSLVNNMSGYSTVKVQGGSTVESVVNQTLKTSDSDKSTYDSDLVTRNVSKSKTTATSGTLTVADGSKVDNVEGFATVKVTDSVLGDAARDAYGSFKETLKVVTNKDKSVTAAYETVDSYKRGGAVTVTGKDAKAGNLTNYNTVTLDKASAGNISNSTLQKQTRKYSKTWESVDAYGTPEAFDMAFDTESAVLLSSLDQYSASGSVTLKNDATAGNITGFAKVTAKAKDGEDLAIGAISAGTIEDTEMIAGSYKKQMTYDAKKNVETVSETVAPAASVTLDGYDVTGSISGYKSVTLSDAKVSGSVVMGESYTSKTTTAKDNDGNVVSTNTTTTYNRNGSLKADDTVINGNVEGYTTVKLTDSEVNGNITQGAVAKLVGTVTLTGSDVDGMIENYSAVNAKDAEIGAISNVAKTSFNGGYNELGSYTGTAGNDTMTIAKNAVLELNGAANFGGGNDKLTITGTLILNSVDFDSSVTLAGKGEVAVTEGNYAAVSKLFESFGGKVLNLGATTEGFRGTAYELADNTAKKAVKLDAEDGFTGWLGDVSGCVDTIDFIKFTDDAGVVTLSSSDFADAVVSLNGNALTLDGDVYKFSVSEGDVLSIERKDKSSMSYSISTLA